MNPRGIGDRWLGGEHVAGVSFAHHQSVMIAAGVHGGQQGVVVLLTALAPEPRYLVRLATGVGEVRVLQSALRAA